MDFVKDLCNIGGEIYKVGGAVRNVVYNQIFGSKLKIKDRDLLVRGIEIETLINKLKGHGTVKLVGQKFGVIKFKPKQTKQIQIEEYDIALPRTEISTGPGYKDFKIVADHQMELIEDLRRRDATINTLAIRIYDMNELLNDEFKETSLVIDLLNGLDDLRKKIWRAVGDPYKRFMEDPTRIMRALRQCAELDLVLEDNTKMCIIKNHELLKVIMQESIVRVTEELVRMIDTSSCDNETINIFFKSGISNLFEIPSSSLAFIKRCNNINSNLRIKIAVLLQAHSNLNAIHWYKRFELSACPHFPKNNVGFIKAVSSLYEKLLDIRDNNDIGMRRLLQACEKLCPNYGVMFSYDLIRYFGIITDSDINNIIKLYYKNQHTILTIAQVRLDGNIMMNKYNIQAKDIKKFKELLFDHITENKVKNDKESLMKYFEELQIREVR